MIKFDVLNRWSGQVQFTAEINCDESSLPGIKMGLAAKWAFKSGADLRDVDLRDADLRGAVLRDADLSDAVLSYAVLSDAVLRGVDLRGADLRDAVLRDADLRDADLRGAVLRDADLSGVDLRGADLRDVDLRDADLRDADLSDAVLSDAVLSDAVLSGVDLSDADLRGADLRSFKADMWMTLSENKDEVPALIEAIRAGMVDGSQYEGECACLVGTIANAKKVDYHKLTHNSRNPAERWFMMIKKGDKPGDDSGGGFAAQKALEWAEEFCAIHRIPFPLRVPDGGAGRS